MNLLILAGGSGTRLWPASRKKQPKQLLHLIGNKTLLQNTYARSLKWVPRSKIYIATTATHARQIQKQLPELTPNRLSIEPVLRERAPAIGLAALLMHKQDPKSSFMCLWSDHAITARAGYFKSLLNNAERFLKNSPSSTITVGVTARFPHTGLGYIEKGSRQTNRFGLKLFNAKSFREKPNQKQAQRFVASKKYLWNSGYFMWHTETLLELYKKHLPEVYKILMQIQPALGTSRQAAVIKHWYSKMPTVDIEKGLLEKITKDIYVIEGDFSWADVGSWKVVKEMQAPGKRNAVKGLSLLYDTRDSLIYNYGSQLVTTLGLEDIAIVVTEDAVLVANKNRSEELRAIIKSLRVKSSLRKYL